MLILFSDALPDAYPSAEKRPPVTYIKSSQQEHPNSTVHFIDRISFGNKSDAFEKPSNNNASKDFFSQMVAVLEISVFLPCPLALVQRFAAQIY